MILEEILIPHQLSGKRFIQKTKYCILADLMGLGKSLTALSVTNKALKVVIVCPAYLRPNWGKELRKWLTDCSKYIVVSYEKALKEGDSIFNGADVIILDEAHYLKTVSADRTKAIHHYIKQYKPKGVILLTGTPIKNRVPELYSLLMLCSYGNPATARLMAPFSNYWQFAENFAWGEQIEVGGFQTMRYSGYRNLPQLKAILETCYLRRLKMDVDLPEMRERTIYIEDLETPAVLLSSIETGLGSDHITKQKVASALGKVPYTIKYAQELLDSGEVENLVIFTDHIESSKQIAKAFKVTAINSTLPIDARDVVVSRFTGGLDKVLVLTIGTGSTGLNLVNTHTMIFNDISWIPGDLAQAMKRINRIGQEKACDYIFMVAGDIDEQILRTVRSKEKTIEAVV